MAITYLKSGVDIDKANRLVEAIKPVVKATYRKEVLTGIGSFGGLFGLDAKKYKEPVLVSSTDGVGTKLKIAFLCDKHDTIGIDAVAMNVGDVLCAGAQPLFFLDYLATGKIDERVLADVIKGIAAGCRQSGCALIGGETAEMPGMYPDGEYDIAGFCVGVVEKGRVINGSTTKKGDVVLGLASSGLHSNGYSLVRRVFSEREQKKLSRILLTPTKIYVKPVLELIKMAGPRPQDTIKGIAHITGGAFFDKVPRIIPGDITFRIYKDAWQVPPIFKMVKERSGLDDRQMYRTLNMGIGTVLVLPAGAVDRAAGVLAKHGVRSWVIGEAVKGNGSIELC